MQEGAGQDVCLVRAVGGRGLRVPDRDVRQLSGDILIKRAALGYVHQLDPAADGQEGLAGR
ncbi:hypothetical protein SDC9_177415 [bioreactor metagenome]|uniref:Uncharacterized protein n=1 Tax=bioreactor metagenome TaxID=1076179 RepID=A0A645GSY8_9ZZZZ